MKDKYGNWWDANSDFELESMKQRPVFWFHRKFANKFERAGFLDDWAYDFRPQGLWGESEIFDNEVGVLFLREVSAGNAGWSTGTMPHWWRARPDGYVERWPIVEASGAPLQVTVSQAGTVTIGHIRAVWPGVDLSDDDSVELRRSVFVMPVQNGNGMNGNNPQNEDQGVLLRQAVDAFHGVADQVEAIASEVGNLRSQVTELQERPERRLPERDENPNGGHQRAADISVYNKFDNASLFDLVLFHRVMRDANYPHPEIDEAFMRAMMVKVEQSYKQQQDEISRRGAMRAMPIIDEDAYGAVHRRVPHLRANEALGSTLVGFGDELVPTLLSSVWWREVYLSTMVAQQFPIFDMPSNPYEMSTIARPTIRFVAELTDQAQLSVSTSPIPSSKPGTSKTIWLAKKIGSLVLASEELFEESVNIDVIAAFGENTRVANAQAFDEVIISGDEAVDEQNSISWFVSASATAILGQTADKLLAVDGLRRMAVDDANTNSVAGAFSLAALKTTEMLMGPRGRFGVDPRQTVLIVDPGVYRQIRDLTEYQSLADVGEMATLVTGMVGQVQGRPVILSDELQYVDATGKIPKNNAGTLGSYILANRAMVRIGRLRNVTVETQKVMGAEGRWLASTARFDVQRLEDGAVAYGYNVTGV